MWHVNYNRLSVWITLKTFHTQMSFYNWTDSWISRSLLCKRIKNVSTVVLITLRVYQLWLGKLYFTYMIILFSMILCAWKFGSQKNIYSTLNLIILSMKQIKPLRLPGHNFSHYAPALGVFSSVAGTVIFAGVVVVGITGFWGTCSKERVFSCRWLNTKQLYKIYFKINGHGSLTKASLAYFWKESINSITVWINGIAALNKS